MRLTRRAALRRCALGSVVGSSVAAAGCLDRSGSGDVDGDGASDAGDGSDGGDGDGASDSGDGGDAGDGGDDSETADADEGISLDAVDAAGSPGGEVPLRPTGKAVLLDFFATWCAPCVPQMDSLRVLRAEFDVDALHIVSITSETDREAVRAFWRDHEGAWPAALDPDARVMERYDATRIPTLVLFDADGNQVWRHVGLADEETLRAEARAAVEG